MLRGRLISPCRIAPVLRVAGPALMLALFFLAATPAMVSVAGAAPDTGRGPFIDPAVRELVQGGPLAKVALAGRAAALGDEDLVPVFLEGDFPAGRLAELGIRAGSRAGRIRTAEVPRAALGALLADPDLHRIQLGRMLEPMLDESIPAIGVDAMWGGIPPNFTGDTGQNVIVGIVDTGIDVNHADFKKIDGSGQTRILSLWDQTNGTAPPAGFTYGREWTAADINAGRCTQLDLDGHGTFLASIAAGNGQATGNGQDAYQYIGVAPQADLMVVKTIGYDTNIIDAVDYIFRKADQLGKNAVVCVAYGTESGSHDGADPMEEALSALSGPDRIVVVPTGNNGDKPYHSQAMASPGAPGTMSFHIEPYLPDPGNPEVIWLEGWYDGRTSASLTVVTPSGQQINVAEGGAGGGDTPDGYVSVQMAQYENSRGDKKIRINLAKTSANPVASGDWQFRFNSSTPGGKFDLWLTYKIGGMSVFGFDQGMSYDCTLTTPSAADSVISVGAYVTKARWTAKNGQVYSYAGSVEGALCASSGAGWQRDGDQSPDITAPGQAIGAAKSANAFVSSLYLLPDGVHRIDRGTSAAAAHVTGSVALLLAQESSPVSAAEMKSRLRSYGHSDSYTGTVPNPDWGFGKLDLTAPTVGVGDGGPFMGGPRFSFAPPFPNPSRAQTTFAFALEATDLVAASRHLSLEIYDVQGRRVASLPVATEAGPQEVAWDGRRAGVEAAKGIYFARLQVGGRTVVQKFIRVR